jgi:amino acid transporter
VVEEEDMEPVPVEGPGLKRSLSVWAAVGLSVALMAPSMAANINPQASATTAGRAVPLTFLIAAVGVLLVAYSFVRLCQYFHHSGSVYAFVGATLGPRAGVVAGWGLLGTYTFYAVVTSTAAGIFGACPAAGRQRARPRALHLERVPGDAGDEFLRGVPGRGVRLPVVRGVRGGVHPG